MNSIIDHNIMNFIYLKQFLILPFHQQMIPFIIFCSEDDKPTILGEAEVKMAEVKRRFWFLVAAELNGEDHFKFLRAYTGGTCILRPMVMLALQGGSCGHEKVLFGVLLYGPPVRPYELLPRLLS